MSGTNQQDTLKIRVSDLAAYADCPRCVQRFWRDHEDLAAADHRGKRSRTRQRANSDFRGKRADEICSHLPAGRFADRARQLQTGPMPVPGHPVPVVIRGNLPVPLELDSGGYAIVRSTTDLRDAGSCRYIKRQLEAYAMLAECHHDAARAVQPLRELWIAWCTSLSDPLQVDSCERVPRDRAWFADELERITAWVRSPVTFDPSPNCTRCRQR